jgi:hypothetical protein
MRLVWQRRLLAWSMFLTLGLSLALEGDVARAHNNPGFKEVLLITVDVSDQPLADMALPSHSEAFSLDLPKKTIELIWRIEDAAGEGVVFAVAQEDKLHAEGLTDGANSRILRGGDIRIVNVEGASKPFRLEVFANVIDRSK